MMQNHQLIVYSTPLRSNNKEEISIVWSTPSISLPVQENISSFITLENDGLLSIHLNSTGNLSKHSFLTSNKTRNRSYSKASSTIKTISNITKYTISTILKNSNNSTKASKVFHSFKSKTVSIVNRISLHIKMKHLSTKIRQKLITIYNPQGKIPCLWSSNVWLKNNPILRFTKYSFVLLQYRTFKFLLFLIKSIQEKNYQEGTDEIRRFIKRTIKKLNNFFFKLGEEEGEEEEYDMLKDNIFYQALFQLKKIGNDLFGFTSNMLFDFFTGDEDEYDVPEEDEYDVPSSYIYHKMREWRNIMHEKH